MSPVLVAALAVVVAAVTLAATWRALPAARRSTLATVAVPAIATALAVLFVQRLDAPHHDRATGQPGGNQDALPYVVGVIVIALLLLWPERSPAARRLERDLRASAGTDDGSVDETATGALPAPLRDERPHGPSIAAVRAGVVSAARGAGWVLAAFVFALFCAAWATSGRAVVPFLLCGGLLGVGALWRRGAPVLAGFAAVGALAAAWGPGFHDTWIDQNSTLVVRPYTPGALFADDAGTQTSTAPPSEWTPELRTGGGRIVLDFRNLKLAARSHLKVRARSDRNRIVVAVPQDRCFRLVVHYDQLGTPRRSLPTSVQQLAYAMKLDDYANTYSVNADSTIDGTARNQDGTIADSLLAFGIQQPGTHGTWTRDVTDPDAPTIELALRSQSQIVIRDFPDTGRFSFAGEQDLDDSPGSALTWPSAKNFTFTPSASEAIETMFDDRSDAARDARIRKANIAWARRQAVRLSGACATRAERARHVVPVEFYDAEDTHRDSTVVIDGNGDLHRERTPR